MTCWISRGDDPSQLHYALYATIEAQKANIERGVACFDEEPVQPGLGHQRWCHFVEREEFANPGYLRVAIDKGFQHRHVTAANRAIPGSGSNWLSAVADLPSK